MFDRGITARCVDDSSKIVLPRNLVAFRLNSSKRVVCQVECRVIQIRNRKVKDVHDVLVFTEEWQVGKEAEIVVKVDGLVNERRGTRAGDRWCLCILGSPVSHWQRSKGKWETYGVMFFAGSVVREGIASLSLACCFTFCQ
jgi:Mlc titration factor MtfA (ptsG expression regulator)